MKTFTKILLFAIVANLTISSTAFGQIALRASSTGTSANSPTSINKPAGVVSGDIMIANIANDNNGGAATSAGWTLISTTSPSGGGITLLYKIAGGAEPASYSFATSGNPIAGAIVAFSGVDNATPFDVANGNWSTGSGTTATAASKTTVTTNDAIVMFGATAGSGNNNNWTGWTTTSPGALTELYDIGTGGAASVGAAWALKATAGATGSGTASTSAGWGAILIALKSGGPATPSATLSPSASQNILVGGSVAFTATASNYAGSGNYTYTWTAAGATIPPSNPNTIVAASDSKTLTYTTAGTYTVNVTIARAGAGTLTTNTTTVNVSAIPASPNLWASSSDGTQISSFTVVNGSYINGPVNLFAPTFPGTTTGGTTTAALGRNDQGGIANGYFYWLPNTSGNNGVMEVFAATSTGATPTRIGSLDVNGASNNSLGFVRLGMAPNGNGWILAGDATNLYLAKFLSNGINAVTITTVPVVLSGGLVSTFQNGDVCVLGNNSMYALANDGSGVTQIFIGTLNAASVTLTKRWDLVDPNNVPFTGSANGVAFDALGSLYLSTATGLFYINQATVNGPAGTVQCSLVTLQTGLQDLASNYFPQGSTLPVNLVSFLGSYRNENTTLTWETENLLNFSHFEIERSLNGRNFVSVGLKNPQGDRISRTKYQFIDNLTGVSGTIFYYRLKMIDADNQFKYSNVILIRKDLKNAAGLVINPNPIVSGVKATASFIASANSTVNFKVIDMSGKVLLTQQNSISLGNNTVTINNLDRLQSGVYILQLNDGESRTTTKFYIVH